MFILYLDESGVPDGSHFVLAGFAIFERQTYHLANQLQEVQDRYFPGSTDLIPFHASQIRSDNPEPPWDVLTRADRCRAIDDIHEVIVNSNVSVFGEAIEKERYPDWDYPELYVDAFQNVVGRFDLLLSRFHSEGNTQRGLVIMADSQYHDHLALFAPGVFWESTGWRRLRNISDIPYFAPARSTRMLQVADFVANAIFGNFNSASRHFNRLASKFDTGSDGVMHGFRHRCRDWKRCGCIACYTKRLKSAPPEAETDRSL